MPSPKGTPAYNRLRVYWRERQCQRIKSCVIFIREAKSKPCADCKMSYPYWVMQFDHVRGKKRFNISNRGIRGSLNIIITEIAKCDVVCANCHANRTYVLGIRAAGPAKIAAVKRRVKAKVRPALSGNPADPRKLFAVNGEKL